LKGLVGSKNAWGGKKEVKRGNYKGESGGGRGLKKRKKDQNEEGHGKVRGRRYWQENSRTGRKESWDLLGQGFEGGGGGKNQGHV